MDTSITPAEQELRRAKEALSYLNMVTAQADRGASIDFDKALFTIGLVSANIQQLSLGVIPVEGGAASGQMPPPQAGGGGSGDSAPSPAFYSQQQQSYGGGGGGTGGAIVGPSTTVHARASNNTNSNGNNGGCGSVTELQRRRAAQVLAELQLIETTLRRHQRRSQQAAGHSSGVEALLGGGGGARTEYSDYENLDKERQGLEYARRRMQQMNSESQAVLQALRGQTARMSGTGEKLATAMESIGVSNTTILQIVRRNQLDAWLVYGGIVGFVVLMWLIWFR